MKVYSFPHGGILFDDPTAPPREESVLSFLPGLSIVPLAQQNGCRSLPVVRPGDTVSEGQLIARGQGSGSANIYSPVPGAIVANTTWSIAHGVLCNSMVIRLEGSFALLGKPQTRRSWRELSPFELRGLISDFGIVDMDGSGAPLTDTISLYHKIATPVTLVLRLVFDDPWLAADYALCKERPAAVAEGALIAAAAACADKIIIAVSEPEKELGLALLARLQEELPPPENAGGVPGEGISVTEAALIVVGARYPQRNKRELEVVLRQYERTEKVRVGEPLCIGPATSAAVFDAVVLRKPALDRYIAVGGSALRRPRVIRARIGTRIAQLFEECGGFITRPKRTAIGSPLLGRPVFSLDEPVSAASYAVFAVGDEKPGLHQNPRVLDLRSRSRLGEDREKPAPVPFKRGYARAKGCIGCGECRVVCPMKLDPEDLYKQLRVQKFTGVLAELSARCHGCGCCEAVCPSRLPLSRLIINPSGGGS
ncbi:MAG: SLBB domain-containing protein [Spirochaetaceae bacterium]|jgi:electron transport complex protein RnfC|nr:SLBB domain-containing protein [Spirochaetaceae bacterium]